jgi:hypothetical protein
VRKFRVELAAAQAGLLICDEAHRLKKSGGNKTISDLDSLGCTRRVLCTGCASPERPLFFFPKNQSRSVRFDPFSELRSESSESRRHYVT